MRYATVFFVLLMCCAAQGLDFANMKFFPVNHPECRGFVVIEEMILSYRFYYVSNNNELEVMLVPPQELNICSVDHVEQSPDGDKVVILSEGEGHPALAIYRISELIAQADKTKLYAHDHFGDLSETYSLSCIAELDPYPGLCDDPKWAGNDTIEFLATDVDFREFDPVSRRAKSAERPVYTVDTWRWKFTDDTFTLLKSVKVSYSPKRNMSRIERIRNRSGLT